MVARRSLGRQFGWLWAAYAVSAFGTWLAFGAFPLIAILVLHAGPAEVSALAAAGLAVGAVVAVPLGPWVEFRRKRPVMIAMDLTRFAALMSVPAAFALGWLSFAQLLVVSVIVAAADIAFRAASGAYLKALVRPEDLLVANGRFESTTWTATALGPPLGGAAIGLFGPVTTVVADAVSYLLSAVGIRAIGGREPRPARTDAPRLRAGDLLDGWRYILTHPALRPLFFNTIAGQRPDHGDRAAARRPHARPPRVRALAVRPRLRRPLRRRPHRLTTGAPARRPVRAAQGHAHRRDAARVLVARAGLHPSRRRRDRARHRRPAWPGHLHGRVQPGARHLPARAHRDRPSRPHPVRVVGHQQRHHRGPDRPVGPAGQPHQPPHRDRDRRPAPPGHPAPAPPPRPRAAARAGNWPHPSHIPQRDLGFLAPDLSAQR